MAAFTGRNSAFGGRRPIGASLGLGLNVGRPGGGGVPSPVFDPNSPLLSWARPAVVDEVVFNVGTGYWACDGATLAGGQSNPTTGGATRPTAASLVGKDVKLILPGSARTGDINLIGFANANDIPRSLTVIGGHLGTGRLQGFASEFLYVEGVRGALTASKDALNLSAPFGSSHKPDVYIQRSFVTGVRGTNAGTHADVYQASGPIGKLYIDDFYGDTNYQGIFNPAHFGIEERKIRRIALAYNAIAGDSPTFLLWLADADSIVGATVAGKMIIPTELTEVYLSPRAGQTIAQHAVWPSTGQTIDGVAVGAIADGSGNVTFPPAFLVKGMIKTGAPASPFASTAGLGYVPATEFQNV